jgi:hypothetical protein
MFARRVMLCVLLTVFVGSSEGRSGQLSLDFGKDFNLAAVKPRDAKVSRKGTALRVKTGHKDNWPGITLTFANGARDLSAFRWLLVDVKNVGPNLAVITCRVDNSGTDGSKHCVQQAVELAPGGRDTLRVPLPRVLPDVIRSQLTGMMGLPGGMRGKDGLDPAKVNQVVFFISMPTADHLFEISNVRAEGAARQEPMPPVDKFFPFIDAFGQYMHRDWPGKTKSLDDFTLHKKEEAADVTAHPGPTDWDLFGGWKAGPQLTATGFFRTEKRQDKWWLVDPEGRLFWSHGIDDVATGNAVTPLLDRKQWFADLPKPGSPLAQFYGKAEGGSHSYFKGTSETFNFGAANYLRKFGANWRRKFAVLAHRRLRSWGMNTIGNWSDPDIYLMHRTPYTATIRLFSKPLAGSEGYWGKFADVFDPSFQAAARKLLAREKGRSAGDPWCIGYFIDNELSWGTAESLAVASLRSPPEQPAKQAFVDDLKKKYKTIDRLNAAWGVRHGSWDALLQATTPPDKTKARRDLEAFSARFSERYFEVCRAAVKEAAPKQLYLGCRFAAKNDLAIRAAAKYCDVVSFNCYQRSLANLRLPEGLDKPVIIGEFHFGALDRGGFHAGLIPTDSQNDRAEAYKVYLHSALGNPCIVGTHWFKYCDQATTASPGGENCQVGFLDVCDTPYPEIIQACREIGAKLYQDRE